MRNRLPRYLAERGMSRERYMALKWCCREYDRMRRELGQMRDPLGAVRTDRVGSGSSRLADPTAEIAARVAGSRERAAVTAIETAAKCVAEEDWPEIILAVCRGRGFEMQSPRPRCGERVFRERVWRFFVELDERI